MGGQCCLALKNVQTMILDHGGDHEEAVVGGSEEDALPGRGCLVEEGPTGESFAADVCGGSGDSESCKSCPKTRWKTHWCDDDDDADDDHANDQDTCPEPCLRYSPDVYSDDEDEDEEDAEEEAKEEAEEDAEEEAEEDAGEEDAADEGDCEDYCSAVEDSARYGLGDAPMHEEDCAEKDPHQEDCRKKTLASNKNAEKKARPPPSYYIPGSSANLELGRANPEAKSYNTHQDAPQKRGHQLTQSQTETVYRKTKTPLPMPTKLHMPVWTNVLGADSMTAKSRVDWLIKRNGTWVWLGGIPTGNNTTHHQLFGFNFFNIHHRVTPIKETVKGSRGARFAITWRSCLDPNREPYQYLVSLGGDKLLPSDQEKCGGLVILDENWRTDVHLSEHKEFDEPLPMVKPFPKDPWWDWESILKSGEKKGGIIHPDHICPFAMAKEWECKKIKGPAGYQNLPSWLLPYFQVEHLPEKDVGLQLRQHGFPLLVKVSNKGSDRDCSPLQDVSVDDGEVKTLCPKTTNEIDLGHQVAPQRGHGLCPSAARLCEKDQGKQQYEQPDPASDYEIHTTPVHQTVMTSTKPPLCWMEIQPSVG
jgi:hypothetical protein